MYHYTVSPVFSQEFEKKNTPKLLFTGRHFWNRKCRKKTWWQQEFAVFECEATANSVTGHACVNSNDSTDVCMHCGIVSEKGKTA